MIENYLEHTPSVHESAFVHERALIIGQVVVGEESTIWPNTTLRGDDGIIQIGAQTSIQDGTVIHSTAALSVVTIGDRSTVGHNTIIHGAKVGNLCLIGMGAILLDNCVIGDGSLIGAGSLITQNTVIPPGSLVMGSPGKVIRPLTDREKQSLALSWMHYVGKCKIYKAQQDTQA